MKTLEVFESMVCGSSGEHDPLLIQLTSDLNYVKDRGIKVRRYNLKDDLQAFSANRTVESHMGKSGQFLPIFLVDEKIVCRGAYPTLEKLAEWLGLDAPI